MEVLINFYVIFFTDNAVCDGYTSSVTSYAVTPSPQGEGLGYRKSNEILRLTPFAQNDIANVLCHPERSGVYTA